MCGGYTHPAQGEAVRQAGRHLSAAGYAVEEIAPPDLDAVIDTWHCIGSTDVLALLAPQMEEHGDPDAQTSMRLWGELVPPTDLRGVLGALARRDLLLWRWLEFMQRYPLVVMPTMGDLPPPHNLDTTREGAARVLDALRVSLIAPVLGLPGSRRACRHSRAFAAGDPDFGSALPRGSLPRCRRSDRGGGGCRYPD